MGIKTIKVLRTVSKIVLLIIVLGLLGWGGYYVYRSIAFRPQNIVVTNITDSSATITWTTSSQMNGVVYYKKDTSVLPGPLGIIDSQIAYDDRDVSDAQKACVDEFNKNAGETKDENFSVSGENFDCEDARVTGMGKYYTHSVTIKNLEPESRYYFAMGDGIWSFKSDASSVNTFALLDEVVEPLPVFGKVTGDDGTYSRDALVYVTFKDGSEGKDSILYSSTTSDDGGWYVDASSIRDSSGNILPLELGNDTFRIKAKYSNYGESAETTYIFGYFETSNLDISVSKTVGEIESFLSKFVLGAYAEDLASCKARAVNPCPSWMTQEQYAGIKSGTTKCDTVGYGNCLKVLAGDDYVLDATEKSNIKDEVLQNETNLNYAASKQGVCVCNGTSCCVDGSCSQIDGKCGYKAGECKNTCSTEGTCRVVAGGAYEHCIKSDGCLKSLTNDTPCNADPAGNECKGKSDGSKCSEGACYGQVCTASSLYDGASCNPKVGDVCRSNCNNQQKYECKQNGNGTYSWEYQGIGTCATPSDATDCTVKYTKGVLGCVITCGDKSVKAKRNSSCTKFSPTCQTANGQNVAVGAGAVALDVDCTGAVTASEVDLSRIGENDLETLTEGSYELYQYLLGKVKEPIYTCKSGGDDDFKKYCKAVGGTYDPQNDPNNDDDNCIVGTCKNIPPRTAMNLIQKTYAAELETDELYTYYLPELGIYKFQLDNTTLTEVISEGSSTYLLYIENNETSGYQPPADPENIQSDEDYILSQSAYSISYEQETTAQQYNIAEGINIVSFNFVPTSTDSGAYMASDVIAQAKTNSVDIKYISTFDGGRWYEAYSCTSDTCTGTDFSIVPGRGYLIYANTPGTITIPGYNLKSSIPVAFSSGWNLVGIHGYTTAYTARTLIDSINKIDGLTANNVSWWPTSKGKYEGLQVENNTEYGLDFAISPTNGYFVRISEFAPSDTTCKSILWNDGGTLNGTCGNTK